MPINPLSKVRDALTALYSQYGPVAAIRPLGNFISKLGFGYIIIEFADGRHAEVAIVRDELHKKYHIAPDVPSIRSNSYLPLISFDASPKTNWQSAQSSPSPSIPHELQMPPQSESPLNIINKLNDYLLQQIFKYLPLHDFCSVADVCTTFRKNAKIIFPLQFEDVTPEIDDLSRFECLSRNFGTMIQSLSINCWLYPDVYTETRKNAVLLILATYFSGPNCQLLRLSLTKLDIDARWHPILLPIFAKLQHLRLESSQISELLCCCNELSMLDLCGDVGQFTANDSQTIKVLDNLKRLSISETKQWRDILFRQLDFGDKVTALKIQDTETEQDYKTIGEICAKFPNMQQLHLAPRLYSDDFVLDGQNEIINQTIDTFKRMMDLKTLTLHTSHVSHISGISGILDLLAEAQVPLVQLILGCNIGYPELNSISHFVSIESLTINGLVLGQIPMIHLITKLPRLKELRFCGEKNPVYWNKHDIKEMVQRGDRLRVLYFGDWRSKLVIFENDFDEILRTIMGRVSKTKLTIIIRSFQDMMMSVSADTIANSSEFLEFKMLPRTV